jgi:hypothetical protein
MDTGLLQRFTQLIAVHAGLQIREEEIHDLEGYHQKNGMDEEKRVRWKR